MFSDLLARDEATGADHILPRKIELLEVNPHWVAGSRRKAWNDARCCSGGERLAIGTMYPGGIPGPGLIFDACVLVVVRRCRGVRCSTCATTCVEPRPWSRQAPGGLPSGVWYTPEAAPLPARAGKEARGPRDSGSLPSRRSKPPSQIECRDPSLLTLGSVWR